MKKPGKVATVTAKGGKSAAKPAPSELLQYPLGRALLFVHLLLSPLIFSAATVEVFEYNKVAILTATAILLLAGAGALAARRFIRDEPAPEPFLACVTRAVREPVALGILLFFLSALCSTLVSINMRTSFYGAHESFAGIITILAYTVLFFGTRALCKDPRAFRILFFATAIGVAGASIYGWMQLLGLDQIKWGRTSGYGGITRVFATMGHPNFLSAFLVMGLPLVLYYALRAFRLRLWLIATALVGTAVSDVAITIMSASRGAWAALVATVFVLLVGWAVVAGERKTIAWIVGGTPVALLLVVGMLSVFPDGREVLRSIRDRFMNMLDTAALSRESRGHIWSSAIRMFKEHPVLGIGLDGFQLAFEHQRTVDYWNVEWNGTPTKANNELLHILSTQGAFGGLALAVMSLGAGIAFLRALKRKVPDRLLIVAVFAGVAGFYVQDFFSFTVAGCGTLFITFLAFLSRLGGSSEPYRAEDPAAPAPRSRRVTVENAMMSLGAQTAFWVAALIAVNAMVYQPFRANSFCRSGASSMQQGYHARALEDLKEAVRIDPTKELYWVRLGTANQLAARAAPDGLTRRSLLEDARKAYEKSIELVPANSYNHANLGRLLGDMVKENPPMATPKQAFDAFRKALELDPNNAYFYSDAGNCALSFGDKAQADAWASKCIELYPLFAPSRSQKGYLKLMEATELGRQGKPEATALFEEAVKLLGESIKGNWYSDESGRAIAGSNLAAALIRVGRVAEASAVAEEAVDKMPDYADARFNLAKAREMSNRAGDAHREYLEVLTRKPDHEMARQALKELRKRMADLKMPLPPLPPKIAPLIDGPTGRAPGSSLQWQKIL